MKAYVFPGQGSTISGMGKELYGSSDKAKALFEQANEILGFRITDIMFEGDAEALRATKVTQPAVFLHSVVAALLAIYRLRIWWPDIPWANFQHLWCPVPSVLKMV